MNLRKGMAEVALHERYRLLETLSEQGDDASVLARRVDTEALVELRILSGELGADRFLGPAFRQLATVLARVSARCPGIVRVYECERIPTGQLVLASEHRGEATLRDELERGAPVGVARALELAARIAAVLERAHGFGLVHGALRPENVALVDGGVEVILTHFGFDWLLVSRPWVTGRASKGRERSAYQAPEQAGGEASAKSDVHALGAVLYEMLAGEPPPPSGVSGAEPLSTRRPDVTPGLERVIASALDPEPGRRPDMSTLREALVESATERAATTPPDGEPAGARSRGRARRLVALGAITALGAAAIWLGHGRPTWWRAESASNASDQSPVTEKPRTESAGGASHPAPAVTGAAANPGARVPPAKPPDRIVVSATARRSDLVETRDASRRPGVAPVRQAKAPTPQTAGETTEPARTPTDSAEDPGAVIDWLIRHR